MGVFVTKVWRQGLSSLFLKVFLWFWLATVLVIAALAAASYLTRPELSPRPPQFIEAMMSVYSRSTVEAYERGGTDELGSFVRRIEDEANMRTRLFDAGGAELAGLGATADERELAAGVSRGEETTSRMLGGGVVIARRVPARGGGAYTFVATVQLWPPVSSGEAVQPGPPRGRAGPFGPFGLLLGNTTAAFAARLVAVILTAGLLCYLMARYLVSPVVKLREATRRVARGDLSARVGPLLGGRRDELAAVGHDFDLMTGRIEKLVGAQSRLLRDISHELRSPLARLNVALDLAGTGTPGALERIDREARRLNEMIGQLLALSRWEAGSEGGSHERFDLATLVREVAEDADFEARSRNRSVTVVVCDECAIWCTPALLWSAVENVIRNAVRHTPAGTAVEISLRCKGEGDETLAVLNVRDSGSGVPEEALTDIFRPFYRVDDARDRETGGTGLGLAITERAVNLHGGTVTAANAADGGLVIEIRLPLDRESRTDGSRFH